MTVHDEEAVKTLQDARDALSDTVGAVDKAHDVIDRLEDVIDRLETEAAGWADQADALEEEAEGLRGLRDPLEFRQAVEAIHDRLHRGMFRECRDPVCSALEEWFHFEGPRVLSRA